jgi:hypothetical protein
MSIASIGSATVSRARVQIPSWGLWWADVELTGEVTLSGAVVLTIADASLSGTIVPGGGAVNGRSGYRIVGGAGGWGQPVAARSYANDAGVKLSTIAQDAATDAGETIDLTGLSGNVGPSFVREAGPASYVLDRVSVRAWYVDAAGTTRFGARTASTITTTAQRVRVDAGAGMLTLATQEIAAIVPGATVDDVTAVDVQYDLSPEDGLRVTLWGSTWGASRRAEALRRLVRSLLPEYRWHGRYEYRVVIQEGERLSLQPVLTSLGLPDVRRVRVRPGVPGAKASHHLGALVEVAFVNADPSRPVVVSFDDADAPGYLPDDLYLDADDTVTLGASADHTHLGPTTRYAAARKGDAVVCGGFGGTITGGSTKVDIG